jgi:hypothetical protein
VNKNQKEPNLQVPPHCGSETNTPESLMILLEPPPWPDVAWVADMAYKLLPRHRRKGKAVADVWRDACEEAVTAHRLAFDTIQHKRQRQAGAPREMALIEHFIVPQLKAKERESHHVSYERGCKLVTSEDKRLRAMKAFEDVAGEQGAEQYREHGFTLEEVWTWRMRWARSSKKFYEQVKKSLVAEKGQKATKLGQPAVETGQKKKRSPKKGSGK